MLKRASRRLVETAARAVDRAAVNFASGSARAPRSSDHFEHRRVLLDAVAARYAAVPGDRFFRPPRVVQMTETHRPRRSDGLEVIDLSWASEYEPLFSDMVKTFDGYPNNRRASARLLTRGQPRPIAVLVHGYLAGHYALEQRIWPIRSLDALGLDVALFVLPFHGLRAEAGVWNKPPFPGPDARINNEGFRQAMADLGDFMAFLRARGHAQVGLIGMSLGAYSSALAATIDKELGFLVLLVPLASLADFAVEQREVPEATAARARYYESLCSAYRAVCPLDRTPCIDRQRTLVIGARADDITPISHARRLAHHFSAPLEALPGGHLLQLGRTAAFGRVRRLLSELELGRTA